MQKRPSPLEIERKFLIRYPEVSWLADRQGSRCAELTQTYLRSDGHGSRRVRSWTESGKTVWYETSKRMVTDITREEIEREISESRMFRILFMVSSWVCLMIGVRMHRRMKMNRMAI